MKSLQSKMILTLTLCMCASLVAILIVDYLYINPIANENSSLAMRVSLEKLEADANNQARGIEQSTVAMYEYAMESFASRPSLLESDDELNAFIDDFRSYADYGANATHGAITAYFVMNAKRFGTQRGFFLTRDEQSNRLVDTELTDLAAYEEDDLEHVGWYYIPVKNGAPLWMSPYLNENINTWMTSYVMPMKDKSGNVVGIVGMDLDYSLMNALVRDAFVFNEKGSAALFDASDNLLYQADFDVKLEDDPTVLKGGLESQIENGESAVQTLRDAAHSSIESGETVDCKFNSVDYRILAKKLQNGMTLVAMVPEAEIQGPIFEHLAICALIAVLIMIASGIVAMLITRSVTRPLRNLANASSEISSGNLDVAIDVKSKDEVGQLAETFKQMTAELRSRMHDLDMKAHVDILTGIGNRAAYESAVERLKADIEAAAASFTLVMMDLNGLKHANDTDGHEAGDALIVDAARVVVSVFGESRSYRFGGDEFAALITGADYNANEQWSKMIAEAIEQFNSQRIDENGVVTTLYSEPLSIAWGIASYDAAVHATYDDVFKAADREMYSNKPERR